MRSGLGDLGRHQNYIVRQLRRWAAQWDASKQREIPEMDAVRLRLEQSIPEQRRSTIVHGDFRLGNAIVGEGGVRAMLDWELCTLGDPMADLGYLLNSWMAPDRACAVAIGSYPGRRVWIEVGLAGPLWSGRPVPT